MNRFEGIFFVEIFNYRGFSLKNEHDFFEGLSTSVISKFARIFFVEIFNSRGFSFKNEVEHDFFEALSTSVISKFARPLPNLTRFGNLYDFAIAS